jgi:hypothetical protein
MRNHFDLPAIRATLKNRSGAELVFHNYFSIRAFSTASESMRIPMARDF